MFDVMLAYPERVTQPALAPEACLDNLPRFWVNMALNMVTLRVSGRPAEFFPKLACRIHHCHFKDETLGIA